MVSREPARSAVEENPQEIVNAWGFVEPHFQKRLEQVGPPRYTGIWHYYSEIVSGDM